jgi:hypothetical protein
MFIYSVNGITDFPVNKEMNGTEQLQVFYDICKMKILRSFVGDTALQRN